MMVLPAHASFSILLANRSYLTFEQIGEWMENDEFQYSLSESKLFNPRERACWFDDVNVSVFS